MNEISVIFTFYVFVPSQKVISKIIKCIIVMICDNLVHCGNLNVIFVPDPFKFILNYSNSS